MNKKIMVAACFAVLLVSMSSVAYAADEAISEVGETELLIAQALMKIVAVFIPAILSSIFIAALGYWKNNAGNFSLAKFLYTVFLSAIIAGITAYFGWNEAQSTTWFANTGLTIPLYWICQGIAARWGKYLPFIQTVPEQAEETDEEKEPEPPKETVGITVKTADPAFGQAEPNGTWRWEKNTELRLMANPKEGYVFDYWEIDGVRSTEPAYFRTVADKDVVYVAHFKKLA